MEVQIQRGYWMVSWFKQEFGLREMRIAEKRGIEPEELFDELAGEGECEFVGTIAARQPLRMITELLGIPREKEDFVLRITNENFGLEDAEFEREGKTREERLGFIREAFAFFDELIESRRREPREDLASVLAQATLRGEPVPQFELFSLLFLVMVAGHDTTRNAISSGLLALLEHPDQFEKLRRDPSLVGTAADEIVRWTTPVNHFVRTATEDCELRGQKIRKGDSAALFYASANRDEEVFEEPVSEEPDAVEVLFVDDPRHPTPEPGSRLPLAGTARAEAIRTLAEGMQELLGSWVERRGGVGGDLAPSATGADSLDADTIEALRAIGYFGGN